MDQYLKPDATYNRLVREYVKHGSLTIGYDFDGTIHDYHNEGASYDQVIQLIRDLKAIGCKVHCWTAYRDHQYVKKYLEEHNIPCDGINDSSIDLDYESRKPFYSALLDDRAGLESVFSDLSRLVKEVRNQTK